MTDLKGKTIVVTGASRGIGFYTALELGKRGAHIIAIARTIGGLEELDDAIKKEGGSTTLVPLDITNNPSLQSLGPSLVTRFSSIDAVVAAAGYLEKLTPVAEGPLEHWTRAIAVNTTANITLIQTLHPLLKQAETPKAVFLTADPAYQGKAFWGFYSASKAALDVLVAAYAAEHPAIKAVTYRPQPTDTRLRDGAYPGRPANRHAKDSAAELVRFIDAL